MSKPGPSKGLERMVGALMPPACRENVLGDLYERYRSNWQYLCEALLTLPLLVASRIRRTADPRMLLIEALATYLSFVAAAWQFRGASFLYDQSGFLRLGIPAITALASLLLFDAYFDRANAGLKGPVQGAAFAAGASLSLQLLLAGLLPPLRLPLSVLSAGGAASVLLVSGLRSLWQAGARQRFQQSLDCQLDPLRMSANEIRRAALRIQKRFRIVRLVLFVAVWPPALVWVSAMWHSPSLLYSVGSGICLAGTFYGVYIIQKGFSRGHLGADPSLAMCLEFYRGNLEARRDILRQAYPRLVGPLLIGTLMVLAADPSTHVFWLKIPGLVLAILFYGTVGWWIRRRAPAFQRQIDALDQAQKQR